MSIPIREQQAWKEDDEPARSVRSGLRRPSHLVSTVGCCDVCYNIWTIPIDYGDGDIGHFCDEHAPEWHSDLQELRDYHVMLDDLLVGTGRV